MKRSLFSNILTFFILSAHIVSAQITDNFSDGNFNQNPSWTGDAANFKISTAGELQLNASGAGQSALFVAGNMPDSSIWDFEVRLAFDPSGSNLVRIFLQTDQIDLGLANGYFIEMGEAGSADAIRFFRQDAGVAVAVDHPRVDQRVGRRVRGADVPVTQGRVPREAWALVSREGWV